MVTIKQALTNTHGVSIRRTIKDLKVGEAFKWKYDKGSLVHSDVWCVRLQGSDLLRSQIYENGEWKNIDYLWSFLEGPLAGRLFYNDGKWEIHQP